MEFFRAYEKRAIKYYANKNLKALLADSKRIHNEKEKITLKNRLYYLKKFKVIGITTSGCGNNHELIQQLNPKVIICEEAGEVIESHILASLTKSTQHLILIGDYKQLRPKINEYFLSSESNYQFNHDISLFERLAKNKQNKVATLNVQRRMRPSISKLLKDIYPNLQNHETVKSYPNGITGIKYPLWFFDITNSKEEKNEFMNSYINKTEAEYITYLAKYFIHQGYSKPDDLTIITPYLGQLIYIKNLLQKEEMETILHNDDHLSLEDEFTKCIKEKFKKKSNGGNPLHKQIRISTIDNFQGEESKIVLISLVRSNDEGNIGFLKTSNRVNVMLSRAKLGMIILGSAQTIEKANSTTMLGNVIQKLKEKERFGNYLPLECYQHKKQLNVLSIKELKKYSIDGGCDEPCKVKLLCSHKTICPRKCHADDLQHKFICDKECNKQLPCGHKCKKKCYEECKCEELINNTLNPCPHRKTIKCCDRYKLKKCKRLIEIKLPYCGSHISNLKEKPTSKIHTHKVECHKIQQAQKMKANGKLDEIFLNCDKKCGRKLNCGHYCKSKCMDCPHNNYPNKKDKVDYCRQKSTHPHVLTCNHECTGICGHSSAECPPCEKPCQKSCVHSTCTKKCKDICTICTLPCDCVCDCDPDNIIRCKSLCGLPCLKLPCNNRCKKLMSCGHQCTGVCGEKCPDPEYGCPICVSEENKDNEISMTDFWRITSEDWDPNDDPIIQLDCNHICTISSLDSHVQLYTAFIQDTETGKYIGHQVHPELIQKHTIPTCYFCRLPTLNIKRYRRVFNILMIHDLGRKYLMLAGTKGDKYIGQTLAYREIRTKNDYSEFLNKLHSKLENFISMDPFTEQIEEAILQYVDVQRMQAHLKIKEKILQVYGLLRKKLTPPDRNNGIRFAFELCILCKGQFRSSYEKNLKVLRVLFSDLPIQDHSSFTDQIETLQEPRLGSMTVNELREVIIAMQDDVGSGIGSFGGHWYTCPNNHLYAIGECGGATELAICPECGLDIGGTQHHVVAGNAPATAILNYTGMDHLIPTATHML